ncbi:sensor histidine kinase [Symbioplanes lichenis]|uniref:sensor histidine kinase n=1 Tax=Symbioplanes lichenis TaxID=1629072 RepID=UPI00273A3398|nr:HAMP domain-containing sensor histidine kinase [Actinoplanes lichenis]
MTDPETLAAQLEQERLRNEQLERTVRALNDSVQELEAFAREVSHDLKAPLAGILGYAQLLENMDFGPARPAEFDDFVHEIGRGTSLMSRLIDDVLAYSTARGAVLHLTDVELTAVLADVAAEWAGDVSRPAPRITWDDLPAVRGDDLMLRRVIDNLIGNAVKYVRPGEAARVHVSADVIPAAEGHEGFVRVEVTDQGIGIPEGQHEAIFGELHRAHPAYPGTGLGLTICRRIVRRLGGEIGADPDFTGGARIWLTLPVARTMILR